MALTVSLKKHGTIPVLEITGRIIDVDVRKFSNRLESLYKKDYETIVLDISKVNFVESQGLGIIIYYNAAMQKEGRQFILLNTNPDRGTYVARLFEITNLNKILRIITDLRDL